MKRWGITMLLTASFSLLTATAAMAGTWDNQEGAWKYRNDDGSYAVSQWVGDQGNWYYVDENGAMKTGWYQDAAGAWYYLDPSTGAMLSDTTITIDGSSCTFDNSGVWVQQQAKLADGWNGSTYVNHSMDYQITVPVNYTTITDMSLIDQSTQQYVEFAVQSPDNKTAIAAAQYNMPEIAESNMTAHDMAEAMSETMSYIFGGESTVSTVTINGCTFEKLQTAIDLQGNTYVDLYFRRIGGSILMIEIVSVDSGRSAADSIMATVKSPE